MATKQFKGGGGIGIFGLVIFEIGFSVLVLNNLKHFFRFGVYFGLRIFRFAAVGFRKSDMVFGFSYLGFDSSSICTLLLSCGFQSRSNFFCMRFSVLIGFLRFLDDFFLTVLRLLIDLNVPLSKFLSFKDGLISRTRIA